MAGVPAVQAAAWLGHSPVEHLRTYAHVVLDRREIDVEKLLADAYSIVRRDAELLA